MSLTEEEYTRAIKRIRAETPDSPEVWTLMEEALAAFPESAQLWCYKGDLIQIFVEESEYALRDALECYRKAAKVDSQSVEAQESIGYFYDVHESNYPVAEAAFRKAIELGAGAQSYVGLARVIAQQGDSTAALVVLDEKNCPFHRHPDIVEIRQEIEDGIWHP